MVDRTAARTRLAPELRRAQIVEAAIEVFAGREPSEVTFEEIADAAGVSRALVYNYFGDRGGLVGAVCLRCFEQLDEAISPAFDPALRPAEQAREWVRRYLQFSIDHPGPWAMISSAAASQHPAVQDARQQRLDTISERWGGTPEARLIAAAVGGMLQAGVTEHDAAGEPLEFDRLVDLLSVLAWKGLSRLIPEGLRPLA
jgi:AcrR family transcriptional regulator